MENLNLELTNEELNDIYATRIKMIKGMSMEYQIGYYVGEIIVNRDLPSLSTDSIQTNKVIKVEPADEAQYNILYENWYNTFGTNSLDTNPDWVALAEFRKQLKAKYLSETLECHVSPVNVVDVKDFKKGINDALWHSDISDYLLDPDCGDEIEYGHGYFSTIIRLKIAP